MNYEPWMEKATPDDMPNEDLKYVAQQAGMRQAMMLIILLAGLTVYIPKNALQTVKKRHIINEYDGTRYTINRLAIECNYSQRYIYKIIKDHLESKSIDTSSINKN